jgi:hypothetical protein
VHHSQRMNGVREISAYRVEDASDPNIPDGSIVFNYNYDNNMPVTFGDEHPSASTECFIRVAGMNSVGVRSFNATSSFMTESVPQLDDDDALMMMMMMMVVKKVFQLSSLMLLLLVQFQLCSVFARR